jgi:hypothetical protein
VPPKTRCVISLDPVPTFVAALVGSFVGRDEDPGFTFRSGSQANAVFPVVDTKSRLA